MLLFQSQQIIFALAIPLRTHGFTVSPRGLAPSLSSLHHLARGGLSSSEASFLARMCLLDFFDSLSYPQTAYAFQDLQGRLWLYPESGSLLLL